MRTAAFGHLSKQNSNSQMHKTQSYSDVRYEDDQVRFAGSPYLRSRDHSIDKTKIDDHHFERPSKQKSLFSISNYQTRPSHLSAA